jgi:hypothetical protein
VQRENHNGTQAGNDTRHTKRDAACHSCCCHFLFFCCWLLTSWKRVSHILFLFFC